MSRPRLAAAQQRPEVRRRHGRWYAFLPATDGNWRVWVPVDSQADGFAVVDQWHQFRASWNASGVGSS